ncbi:hypothetical protein Patl1_06114 [Pistacia atlantica]|uniref:Uncharacterized protein n=2 Tax=Pistacia atlantica TaxID=434234 RepID=A0ACC1BW10_9ROSI|nr:hypothetical protein Patl1_06107 [Pistacia atlantica]KAJ0103122.1 hypothetical protein Patl1_06114 [Pistacia atlantica]
MEKSNPAIPYRPKSLAVR